MGVLKAAAQSIILENKFQIGSPALGICSQGNISSHLLWFGGRLCTNFFLLLLAATKREEGQKEPNQKDILLLVYATDFLKDILLLQGYAYGLLQQEHNTLMSSGAVKFRSLLEGSHFLLHSKPMSSGFH